MAKRKSKKSSVDRNHLTLADISPITPTQNEFFENYSTGKSQVLLGHSGVGKTYLSMYKAFEELSNQRSDATRIVIVRSTVPTRDVGFLPGNVQEKGEIYELPYKAICSELFGRGDAYDILKKHNTIEFMTTSFVRGLTLDNSIIIVDEFQNMTSHEASSIFTRLGMGSKIIFSGDLLQTDFTNSKERDIGSFLRVLENMPNDIAFTRFKAEDIVRSGIVKQFILAQAELGLVA